MTRVLMLGADEALTRIAASIPDHLVVALDHEQVDALARVGGIHALIGDGAQEIPDILVLGTNIPESVAFSIAESVDTSFPSVQVVLVSEPNTELILRAMRAGIRDIVQSSISQDELKVLFHRLGVGQPSRIHMAEEPPALEERSRIIVVAGPRGGVGRSTVASNVAVALAKTAPLETVLVDLDLQFGDTSTMLNLSPLYSISDAFESNASLDNLILKTFLTVHQTDLYVLCGSTSPTAADKISGAQIKHLLKQLSSQFRYVVVDTAAGMDEIALSAIEEASDLILVSSMDLTSTRALRKEIDALAKVNALPASRHHVVLNFADRRSGVGVREVESAIGLPVHVVIPRSHEVQTIGNLGEVLIKKKRRGAAVKGIRKLVDLLHEDDEMAVSKHRGVHVH